MVRIVFSDIAKYDLRDIVEYIKRDSPKYAFLERKRIEDAIDKLMLQPFIGRIVPEINEEHVREMIFRNYRIIYEIKSDTQIYILTIHHHARSFANNPALGE